MSKLTKIILAAALAGVVPLVTSSTADAQPRRGPRGGTRVIVAGPYYSPWFYNSWYGYPYGYPFGYPYPPFGYGYGYDRGASLRLQVEPRQAEVFVDGYYAGVVDDFDGALQRLRVEPGEHDVQVYLQGYRSVHQKVYLQPGKTFSIKQTLQPLGPGDQPEERPAAPAVQPVQGATGGNPAPAGPPAGRRRGPAPAVRAEGESGSIALRVRPSDAEVLVDGEPWQGSNGSDMLVIQLSAGEHRIEVRKQGYGSFQSTVRVRPSDTTPVNVSLSRD